MWYFKELQKGEPERDPHEAEFFNVGELDAASSLVREVIQNSLDARREDCSKTTVRFTFGEHEIAEKIDYYSDISKHLKSCGLLTSMDSNNGKMPFIVIEDFGTTGLDGKINQEEIAHDEISNYHNFWWCEGKSEKRGLKAGRWGLGKTVYFVSSKLRTLWGLTNRYDDKKELLLGKVLMKTHKLENKRYNYYGYYTDEEYLPLNNKDVIADFKESFKLSRKDEAGLSIVIPMPVDGIYFNSIIRATILHYFFPICKGDLIVEVINENSNISINRETCEGIAIEQDWENTSWEKREIFSLMGFVKDVIKKSENESEMFSISGNKIEESSFGESIERIRELYNNNDIVWIRTHLDVLPKKGDKRKTFFDVFLKKDDDIDESDEFFIRSGITISEMRRTIKVKSVRALLNAEEKGIATFLGDSESPAHTEWKERTEGFKDEYSNSANTLRLVKNSMSMIVNAIEQPVSGEYKDLLKDIFFVVDDEEPQSQPQPPKRGTKSPTSDVPEIEPRQKIYDLVKSKGGFKISLADKRIDVPFTTVVRVAYSIRRGNPFKHYNTMDFDFNEKPINIDISGATIIEKEGNRIKMSIESADFGLQVTGFDEKRDLETTVRKEVK